MDGSTLAYLKSRWLKAKSIFPADKIVEIAGALTEAGP